MAAPPEIRRPLLRVALPVAVAAVLVVLAAINIVLVKVWSPDLEDGVLWRREGVNVVAAEIIPRSAAANAGLRRGDVLLQIDGQEITTERQVVDVFHRAASSGTHPVYVVERAGAEVPLQVPLTPMPSVRTSLYYSLALVGMLAVIVGASVRLRRPADPATLHFFWLTVAFCGALAFTPSGQYDWRDYFFDWADAVARFALPPMFFHFALVFPERPNGWVRSAAGRTLLPVIYVPAFVLGLGRVALMMAGLRGATSSRLLGWIEIAALVYLAAALVGGLAIMMRALARHRSVTARRQLRWIVWGSSLGALPFVVSYVVPFVFGFDVPGTEYTAVLLGCIPLAFASAIVRYRLMDIEVIIKKALVATAFVILLVAIYLGAMQLVSVLVSGESERRFWALLTTLVVALIAPSLRNAVQAGLDRLYYRDRYDYRRALVGFARDLNSDLDLDRLSTQLVERVAETLSIARMALFLPDPRGETGRFVAVASIGFDGRVVPAVEPVSMLGARIVDGQMVAIDDPVAMRRLKADEAAPWRDVGLFYFVPCVSKDVTIAVLSAGRRAHGEPLSSEDLTLLGAVAAQAATAIENARLYGQLSGKASEIERLRQFSDSVVESLSDGLLVVDLEDRVLRWNHRLEQLVGTGITHAKGQPLDRLFSRSFVDTLAAARRESPFGTTLYRVTLQTEHDGERRSLLLNVGIAPFRTSDQTQAGWILVLEDVTDRANLEEQLRLSEKMAAIGLLAAGVAHEVNTPLTGISSFTQMLLERSAADDPRTHLLEKIEQQTFRAAKIVNSLLNLSRPTGREAGPIDLSVVITDVLALLEHQFKLSRIQVRRELESGVVVRGVEYKLQQVFLNLFLNARDAMPKGGWLTIRLTTDDHDAIVEVADTGGGIPAEHIARIYDPFFTTKTDGRGTGLGLSVTYGIVQEHGGTLTCDSDVGQGTRFRLVLPKGTGLASVTDVESPAPLADDAADEGGADPHPLENRTLP
jgi:two-component system, NtrC family, sensor kinase